MEGHSLDIIRLDTVTHLELASSPSMGGMNVLAAKEVGTFGTQDGFFFLNLISLFIDFP